MQLFPSSQDNYRSDCKLICLYIFLFFFSVAALVTALLKVQKREEQRGFHSSHVETMTESKDEGEVKQIGELQFACLSLNKEGLLSDFLLFHFLFMCPWIFEH